MLGDRVVDLGGKNIGRKYTLFREFTDSMGGHPYEYFGVNSSQVREGKIVTFDSKRRWRSLLNLARDATGTDALRFGRFVLRVKRREEDGYLSSPYFRKLGIRCGARPVNRFFSPEFCRRIIRPMSIRMNGAEPDEIYMGTLGSNIRMVLDSFDQLQKGVRPLLESFAGKVKVHLGRPVQSIVAERGRIRAVRVVRSDGRIEELGCAGVILATPAPITAHLLQDIAPALAQELKTVAYYPVMLVVAEYDREIFSSQVRALVFDEGEPISNAGAYGINDLNLVRYTFSGRTARLLLKDSAGIEELLQRGEEVLNRHVPVNKSWRKTYIARHFELGLCAYTPIQAAFLDRLRDSLRGIKGLGLTGDYIEGASIEACFRAARSCAERAIHEEA